ncbi:MAG: hypothetical protein IJ761_06500 [Bacteroidales bacterium]|nr:hypothetical protein [Bacteroidales bacterium]
MVKIRVLLKKTLPLMLIASLLTVSVVTVSCASTEKTMYERKQSNKSRKVNSNIKVKGTNKANSHTTRSF